MKNEISLNRREVVGCLQEVRDVVFATIEDVSSFDESREKTKSLVRLMKMIFSLDIVMEMVENDA